MTTQEYLKLIIESQTLFNDSDEIKALSIEREKVEQLLREHFGNKLTIRYGGSKAKGTMIRAYYDLDIICYFNHEDISAGKTLEEIYKNVDTVLNSKYQVVYKTSALRLENKDPKNLGKYFHIDVIPGRFVDNNKDDAFMYQNNAEKGYLKTNIQKHIDHIKNSKLTDIIKIIKYWNIRNGVQMKTFVLELLVVKILAGIDQNKIDTCLNTFWDELAHKINNIKIEDPANPAGNDLSELFNQETKNILSSKALISMNLAKQNCWEKIFGEVNRLNDKEKIASIQIIKSRNFDAPKPWCNI